MHYLPFSGPVFGLAFEFRLKGYFIEIQEDPLVASVKSPSGILYNEINDVLYKAKGLCRGVLTVNSQL